MIPLTKAIKHLQGPKPTSHGSLFDSSRKC